MEKDGVVVPVVFPLVFTPSSPPHLHESDERSLALETAEGMVHDEEVEGSHERGEGGRVGVVICMVDHVF